MDRIPLELISYIISFLQDNKPALSACSLCCSSFSAASKPLLFHTLRTRINPKGTERFKYILQSGPTVLPLIKRIDVTVSFLGASADTIQEISKIATRRHTQHTPLALNVTIQPTPPSSHWFRDSTLVRLSPVVDWITSLELGGLDVTKDTRFWDLILSFQALKSLVLGRVNVNETEAHAPFHRKSEISHLSLRPAALDELGCNICRFLTDHPMPLPSLTSLDARFPVFFGREPIRFGEQHGPKIRTLRFGILVIRHSTMAQDRTVVAAGEFISRFSNLEKLTLQGLVMPSGPVEKIPITFEWIPIVLRRVSLTVRRFTMEVVASYLPQLCLIPWSDIDQILAYQIQSMIVVEVLLATPIGTTGLLDNVYQDMEKRLPLAAQRGVLRCSAVAEHPI